MRTIPAVLFASSLLALALVVAAQERITLSTPDTGVSLLRYEPDRLVLQFDNPATPADEGVLQIFLRGVERPASVTCEYTATTTPTATTLLVGLNKANMASAYASNAMTGSLRQRIHHRLTVMGEAKTICDKSLTGTLTGAPQ